MKFLIIKRFPLKQKLNKLNISLMDLSRMSGMYYQTLVSLRDERNCASQKTANKIFNILNKIENNPNYYKKRFITPREKRKKEHLLIIKRRLAGETLQSIANSYGVSRERIRQITGIPKQFLKQYAPKT